ncbi:Os11g0508066 [Oryza sativa Japonica Group]|uniref:Os11g0508066 protein n=1 Tax=Oryza sativa subsp. japonica TaxID=39947 RepID=A0A0P0Y323_ORYSJ|nr:Os11g0508066 [Oryza sativa Japonica Group]
MAARDAAKGAEWRLPPRFSSSTSTSSGPRSPPPAAVPPSPSADDPAPLAADPAPGAPSPIASSSPSPHHAPCPPSPCCPCHRASSLPISRWPPPLPLLLSGHSRRRGRGVERGGEGEEAAGATTAVGEKERRRPA